MSKRACFQFCFAILLMNPGLYSQQTPAAYIPAPRVSISQWVNIVRIPAVANAPFSAITRMDDTQTLPDGKTVTTQTMTTIARDSKGRTHNENRYSLKPSDQGEGRIRDITIYDADAGTRTTLNPATLQATVVPVSPRLPRPANMPAQPRPEGEDLGQATIEGMPVQGLRRSQTIPAGADGNDRALTITDEYWYSDDLHLNMSVKHTDPRHGTQTMVLTQLKRDEPDPKMFEIPPGYTVQTENPATGPVRISPAVAEANLIQRVEPIYPALAASARVQGSVEFNIVIGEDGLVLVKDIMLVRGHPLLITAAKEAVQQWRYQPTLFNGAPVKVMTSVIVNFSLAGH